MSGKGQTPRTEVMVDFLNLQEKLRGPEDLTAELEKSQHVLEGPLFKRVSEVPSIVGVVLFVLDPI